MGAGPAKALVHFGVVKDLECPDFALPDEVGEPAFEVWQQKFFPLGDFAVAHPDEIDFRLVTVAMAWAVPDENLFRAAEWRRLERAFLYRVAHLVARGRREFGVICSLEFFNRLSGRGGNARSAAKQPVVSAAQKISDIASSRIAIPPVCRAGQNAPEV